MGTFPNPGTQFQKGVGGNPLRKPRPKIGKRRAISMRSAMLTDEALNGRAPAFEGDSVDYLRAIMRGEITADPVKMAAAMALTRFDRPALSATAVTVAKPAELVDPEVRRERIRTLLQHVDIAELVAPPAPTIEATEPAVDLDAQARRAALEAEQRDLLRRIAEAEQRQAIQRAASGFTFKPAVAAPSAADAAWRAAREAREREPTRYNAVARAIEKLR